MRPLWKDVLAAVWLGMILPGIVLNGFVLREKHRESRKAEAMQVETLQMETVPNAGQLIPVRDQDGSCVDLELDTYLTGVLLAEMPADFHTEALKAQAVAARTYAWKAHTTGGKHGDGTICTDPACCQAYMTEEDYFSRGGTPENLERVHGAVLATSGFGICYDGELIEATYFSSSGGSTESAVAVWGADYPYLQSVSSPEDVYEDTVCYTKEEFEKRLGISLPENPEVWFGTVAYTEGGGVAVMEICGESYTGPLLRSLLGLRSTDFRVQTENQTISITTRGYGHRVGMSQYGASAMAEAGSTWQEILQHYYPGTILVPVC